MIWDSQQSWPSQNIILVKLVANGGKLLFRYIISSNHSQQHLKRLNLCPDNFLSCWTRGSIQIQPVSRMGSWMDCLMRLWQPVLGWCLRFVGNTVSLESCESLFRKPTGPALYWGKPYPREGEGGDQVPQEPGCGHRPNTNTSKIEGNLFWKILIPSWRNWTISCCPASWPQSSAGTCPKRS